MLDNIVQLNSDHTLVTDENSLPTGKLASVVGTPFDFRKPKVISKDIRDGNEQLAYGYGYDQTWVLKQDNSNTLQKAALVLDPKSKRTLEISTTQPSIQFYTANHLLGNVTGANSTLYRQGDAFALETQHYPDSPNKAKFPSTRLNPGQTYYNVTIFKFGVAK